MIGSEYDYLYSCFQFNAVTNHTTPRRQLGRRTGIIWGVNPRTVGFSNRDAFVLTANRTRNTNMPHHHNRHTSEIKCNFCQSNHYRSLAPPALIWESHGQYFFGIAWTVMDETKSVGIFSSNWKAQQHTKNVWFRCCWVSQWKCLCITIQNVP